MSARRILVVLADTGEDEGPVHCRAWELPDSSVEAAAVALSAAYGEPVEWVLDEATSAQAVFFWGG